MKIFQTDDCTKISVYRDELTKEGVVKQVKKIKQAFPALPGGFYEILMDRIKDKKFTDDQLKGAINHVIDNCVYPTPTIANFMSYDKTLNLYNHSQMLKLFKDDTRVFSHYKPVILNFTDVVMWASLEDIDKYKLTRKTTK